MDRLSTLRAEAADVAERLESLAALDTSDNAADTNARDLELKGLTERATKLAGQIDFETKVAESAKNLRSVAERCSPAPEVREEPKAARIDAVRDSRTLKAFRSHEDAYRVGRWLQATFAGDSEAKRWCHDHGVEARTMVGGVNSLGGFSVPDELSSTIIRNVETYGVAPTALQNFNMSSDVLSIPKRISGVSGAWMGENAEFSYSDMTGTQVQLVAQKFGVATKVSNELFADGVGVADLIATEHSLAIAKALDEAVFIGDGTSTYGGHYGVTVKLTDAAYSASLVTAAANNGAFETLDKEDFLSAMAKLPRYALPGARWYISPAGYHASMQRLDLAQGGSVSVAQGFGLTFLGYPVVLVHSMNSTLGSDLSKVKCLFGDLAMAGALGLRQGYQLRVSQERFVELDQTLVSGVVRATANFHSLGSTSEVGPVVALRTHSANA
jgi:HK97 family phage major capsid protein